MFAGNRGGTEGVEAGLLPPPLKVSRAPTTTTRIKSTAIDIPDVITDEPVVVRIDASANNLEQPDSGGAFGSGGDGDVAAAAIRPPLPGLRKRVPEADIKPFTGLHQSFIRV